MGMGSAVAALIIAVIAVFLIFRTSSLSNATQKPGCVGTPFEVHGVVHNSNTLANSFILGFKDNLHLPWRQYL